MHISETPALVELLALISILNFVCWHNFTAWCQTFRTLDQQSTQLLCAVHQVLYVLLCGVRKTKSPKYDFCLYRFKQQDVQMQTVSYTSKQNILLKKS